MTKETPKKRKQDSLNEAPSQPDGVRRPSEGGVGKEYSRGGGGSSNNPPSSTSI